MGNIKTHLRTLKYMAIGLLILFGGMKVIDWLAQWPNALITLLVIIFSSILYISIYNLVKDIDE